MNLFVYGTLRKGFHNQYAAMLAECSRFGGTGKVQGDLYLVAEYSGLVLSEGGWVVGDVFELDANAAILGLLDEYEGSVEFQRAETRVLLDSGEWIDAQVYVYAGDTTGMGRIESGDYVDWLQRQSPTAMKPAQ